MSKITHDIRKASYEDLVPQGEPELPEDFLELIKLASKDELIGTALRMKGVGELPVFIKAVLKELSKRKDKP